MNTLKHYITINNKQLRNLKSVVIKKSERKLEDTAEITIPLNVYNKYNRDYKVLKRGDEVVINLFYKENIQGDGLEFSGFITYIEIGKDVKIHLEDHMFWFKDILINPLEASADIKELNKGAIKFKKDKVGIKLSDIIFEVLRRTNDAIPKENIGLRLNAKSEEEFEEKTFENTSLDSFTVEANSTGYQVFSKLKEILGLSIYMRGKELYVERPFTSKLGDVIYDFKKNVATSNLRWIGREGRFTKVIVVSHLKKETIDPKTNKKVKVLRVEVGKEGGDVITHNVYNVPKVEDLRKIGEDIKKDYEETGLRGSFTTWLVPYCSFGYHATIRNSISNDANNIYYVKGVDTSFSDKGARRTIHLGNIIKKK